MIPVAVLGATGSVGQMFLKLLEKHPWFTVKEVVASERSVGRKLGTLTVQSLADPINSRIIFSGLDSAVAGEVEKQLAQKGHLVISNCRNWRMDPTVPLMIPEVNPEQMQLLDKQPFERGKIITNPNCCVVGLAMALKPLHEKFGIEQLHVVTLQAISGAGFNKRKELNIDDNVLPFISGEEEKIPLELEKILGLTRVSAHCNRVNVTDGHLKCVSLKLSRKATIEDLKEAWESFHPLPQQLKLPSAPLKPVHFFVEENFPQPKIHRDLEGGMAVSVGRLRPCTLFDYKFSILSHNTIRGAAGCAILNAELLTHYQK